ncbi:hypothetical protein AX14_013339 [Amanita brunnescens Koide BX004]|nr:hypothetical protein AX14_013339 [Amanita brunnescens Koide BX004]
MAHVTVPRDHVGLVLLQNGNSFFYLEIPLDTTNSLCLRPLKYLHFLGWCILGVEGVLAFQAGGDGIGDNGDLTNRRIYHYVPTEELDFTRIVDLEVIKLRTNVPSETTQTRDDFRRRLLRRDARYVWTGTEPDYGGVGLYIIPYKRGPGWFRLIIENRPDYGEKVGTLDDVNDIRNGVFASPAIYAPSDQRFAVVLKTPNPILEGGDVPARHDRAIGEDVTYPASSRYTLQRLKPAPLVLLTIPNNIDATFKRDTRQPKPSDILLHYNYGAAAVKIWGRNTAVLKRLATPPRPPVPVPAEAGPSKDVHDRTIAIKKPGEARNRAEAGARAGAGLVESEGQATLDEDDIMLFFWGNTKAAQECHIKKANEDASRIEQWTGSLPQGSA